VAIVCKVDDSQTIPSAEDVPFSQLSHLWESTAGIDSTQCEIHVTAAATSAVSDLFTIYECSPLLTADLNADCFVDMADVAEFARQWLDCGNPHDAGCLLTD
jgi:hypothetical protein